jgi:rare lipoprotein A
MPASSVKPARRRKLIGPRGLFFLICSLLWGCAAVQQPPGKPAPEALPAETPSAGVVGLASYYGEHFRGHLTASGERYDPDAFTAAHRTYPLGTRVRVTNLENGRRVTVRINDRGPYVQGRLIDLSVGAARQIGLARDGVVKVLIEVLGR